MALLWPLGIECEAGTDVGVLLLDRLRGREKFKDGRSKGWQPVDVSEFADGDRQWERLAAGDMGACGKDRALLDDNLRG